MDPIPCNGRTSEKVEDLTDQLRAIYESVRQWIDASNNKYKEAADRHRRKVTFEVGDYVLMVLTKD